MKKILVIDDEEKVRRIYSRLLTIEGFEVIEAQDADCANEILKKDDIDLVLLDIKMPIVDGSILYEIMQLFHKKVKVIVASVYPLDEQKRIIRGATDYYDKSEGIDLLLTKVKRVLKDGPTEKNANWKENKGEEYDYF